MALSIRPADTIKMAVIKYLIEEYPGIVIGNEVMYGTTGNVVDLLSLYLGETYAIEIKSEKDNTKRLKEQMKEYSNTFDHTFIFTSTKHLSEILSMAPPRVSVYEVCNENIKKIKYSNKKNRPIKKEMVHSISTSFLRNYLSKKEKVPTNSIRDKIVKKYKREEIRRILYLFFEKKITDGFNLFLQEMNNSISSDNLSLLSAKLKI